MNIQNLNDNLRDIIHYANSIQKELDKNNSDNKLLCERIKDYERQCSNFNNDNTFLNDNILKERALRCDKERQNNCLNVNIYKFKFILFISFIMEIFNFLFFISFYF